MRVLQINAVINKGSTGIISRDIGKTIIGYGGEVFCVSRKRAGKCEVDDESIENNT